MTDKNIRDLPRTSVVTSSDVIHLNQGGLDRSITAPDFLSEVNGGSPFNVTVIEDPSDSRTLSSSDINAYIYFTFQSTAVVTIPTSLSDNMKIGETITIRNDVLGNVVISGEAGVNISQAASGLVLSEIGQVGQVLKVGNNSYHFLTGGTATTELTVEGLSFGTVATLKSAVNVNGATILDWGDFLGQKVSTVVNNTISNDGGAPYIITNVNPGNLSTLVNGIWVGSNHDLGGGFYAKIDDKGILNALQFGVVGGDSPTSDSFEVLIRYAINNGKAVFLPLDNYYLERDIDVSDTTGNLSIYSDAAGQGARTVIKIPRAKITFNDNGTDSTGRIGLNLGTGPNTALLNGIHLSTLVSDARAGSGNFTGIVADGRGSEVKSCRISGFKTALHLYDIGYSNWGDNYYQGNSEVLKHSLESWEFGTTFRDINTQSVQNTVVYNVPSLFHSHWENNVHEFASIVIKDIGSGCSVTDCYFEFVSNGCVNSPIGAADVLCINNFYHSPSDLPVTSNDTTANGFDRCGLMELDNNQIQLRALRFVDRSGVPAGYIQASRTSAGQLQLTDKDYNVEGNVPAIEGSGQNSDRLIKSIVIHNGTVYGLPSGWTFNENTTGVYQFTFDASILLPNIQVTSTTTSVSASNVASHQLTMTEAGGGAWSSFRNASGFIVRGFVNGSLSQGVVLNINIII